jgi:hypothetical protein
LIFNFTVERDGISSSFPIKLLGPGKTEREPGFYTSFGDLEGKIFLIGGESMYADPKIDISEEVIDGRSRYFVSFSKKNLLELALDKHGKPNKSIHIKVVDRGKV